MNAAAYSALDGIHTDGTLSLFLLLSSFIVSGGNNSGSNFKTEISSLTQEKYKFNNYFYVYIKNSNYILYDQ